MFKLPTRPGKDAKPIEGRRYFWTWFLTNSLFNLVDIENMDADMETSFKMSTLVFGRSLFFNDKNGVLRCLWFANGGDVPIYPGQIISFLIANPVIGEYRFNPSQNGVDCVPVYLTMLDRMQAGTGFYDLVTRFADDLAENDVSLSMVQFLKRLPVIFKAKTDAEKQAIIEVLTAIYEGRPEIVAQSPLASLVERMDAPQNNVTPLSEFTEYQQYKIGLFYSILGVNSVWNMKREHVAAAENVTNGETARYNIADIIDNLNQQLDEVNKVFNTSFNARLNVERAAEIAENVEETPPESETDGETETETEGET